MSVLPYGASTYSKSWVAFGQDAPVQITHSDGWRAFDVGGNGYVDCIMGLGSVLCGHRNLHIDTAIRRALNRGTTGSLGHPSEELAARRVLAHFPAGSMLQWGTNGSDATTGACRLARLITGRRIICPAYSGYHGFHDWALTDTTRGAGIPRDEFVFRLTHPPGENTWLDNNADGVAAIIIEPDAEPKWLSLIREWCTKHGALMISDEVMCWQRYAEWTGSAHYGVQPDIWCLGKSLGNGMPVSAIVGRSEILKRFAPGPEPNAFFSSTWAGHPLSMAAVIATIEAMEEQDGPKRLWKKAEALKNMLYEQVMVDLNRDDQLVWFEPHTLPFLRIKHTNANVAHKWRRLMNEAGVLIYAAHNLSLAHDEYAMKRILDGWGHVALHANELLAVSKLPPESGNGVMRR